MRAARGEGCPIALGDDLTDEDMFAAVEGWGVAVLVGDVARPTLAGYRLRDPLESARFLQTLGRVLFPPSDGAASQAATHD